MRQTSDLALMTSIPVHVQECVRLCGSVCVCVCVCVCVRLQLAVDRDMTNEGPGQK